MLAHITPLILTFNEAPNIARTLSKLEWSRRVVVVDSYSTDATVAEARSFKNVVVYQREFDSHAGQWSFGLHETSIDTEWALALDADYVLTDELVDELRKLQPAAGVNGYQTKFDYVVFGHRLRNSVYPPVTTLYRAARARYIQDGHTQRVVVDGTIAMLEARIEHDDRKPIGDWLRAQDKYMLLEARKLLSGSKTQLTPADRLRTLIVIAPFVMFFWCLIWRGGLRDGMSGLYYSIQRSVAELILSLHLLRIRLTEALDTPKPRS